jgi:hypothetical protein
LALLAFLLCSCATASPNLPSPTAPATAPEESAAETTPASSAGEVLFRLERLTGIGPLIPVLTLYADGRLLDFNAQQDRFAVRVLGREGIDTFLAEVRASGSFAATHDVPLEPLPGVEPPGMEVPLDRFTLASGGGSSIEVTTIPFNDPRWTAPSAERDVLIALAERLLSLDWLPSEAWVRVAPIPYAPEAYLLFSGFAAFPPQDPICLGTREGSCARDLSTEVWPVSLPPDGIGVPFRSADGAESTIDHCAVIEPAFAETLAAAMRPEPPLVGGLAGRAFVAASIPWRERNGFYDMQLRPLLPEESLACAGKSLPR